MQIQWMPAAGREKPHTQLNAERKIPGSIQRRLKFKARCPDRCLVTTEVGIFLLLEAAVTSAASFPHLGCPF